MPLIFVIPEDIIIAQPGKPGKHPGKYPWITTSPSWPLLLSPDLNYFFQTHGLQRNIFLLNTKNQIYPRNGPVCDNSMMMPRLLRVQKGESTGVASAYLRHESAHNFPESDSVFYHLPRTYSPWRLCILLKTIRLFSSSTG